MYTEKIEQQELRTRKAMDKLIPSLFKNVTNTNWTNTEENIDYQFTAATKDGLIGYDVEVKELGYSYKFYEDLGYCGIKCKKKALMEEYNKESCNDKLIYLMVCTDAIIVYDIKKLDMNKCPLYLWKIKTTQYNENSKVEEIPSFKLPLNQAAYIKYINKSKYYD